MNNLLSYSSLKLDLFSKEGVHIRQASGFVLEAGNQHYLITNQHILSGRDFSARGEPEVNLEPFKLKTSIHIQSGEGEYGWKFSMSIRKRMTIQLYDDNNAPAWIEHRAHAQDQPMLDVIALPIQSGLLNEDKFLRTITGRPHKNIWSKISAIPVSALDVDVEYGPPDTVYTIGYPLSWAPAGSDKSSAAFWRTSSIASEVNETGMISGTFFIDPSAPEGMTGSPVVGMKNNQIRLLGVYSDISTADFGANAGLVWDARLIKELLRTS